MKIDFISVHYNNPRIIEKFFSSILNQDLLNEFDIKIYMVDNASEKNNKKNLKKIIKSYSYKLNITLLESNENLGYFPGMNRGLSQSNYRQTPFKIICNNDIEFRKDFLSVLRNHTFEKRCFAIYPDVISPDGSHHNPRVINSVSIFRKFSYRIYFMNYFLAFFINLFFGLLSNRKESKNRFGYEKESKIHLGVGACIILSDSFLSRIEKLDDRVFLWGEEVLLSHQIRQEGGYQYYFPNLKIFHEEHSTVSGLSSKKKYDLMQASYRIYKNYL